MPYDKTKIAPAKFNPDAYKACDDIGKHIIANYLIKHENIYVKIPKENRKVDIHVILGEGLCKEYHEVEIKSRWIGEWPSKFNTVDIPYRKHKLFRYYLPETIWFWVISGDLKYAWKVNGKYLYGGNVSTKYTTRGEDTFFNVPLDECELITLKEDVDGD